MSVWLAIPSARPEAEALPVIAEWRARGYHVALWRDTPSPSLERVATIVLTGKYPGYARAVNTLVDKIVRDRTRDPRHEWIVTGGDDTWPADEAPGDIADQLRAYFRGTFGVMQPTGDRFAGGCIDRIAGSPWIGREFCERAYGGRGPYWPQYEHMFVDEELQEVAIKLGCFLQRPDLVHFHRQFMRATDAIDSPAVPTPAPPHLVQWNTPQHWHTAQSIFRLRRAHGFPGHEPLPAEALPALKAA